MFRTPVMTRILAVAAAVLTPGPAWGQTPATELQTGKPWLQWLITLGMAVVCILVAFKNAKRSHQD